MSLTPTQLNELQLIVEAFRGEFPNSDDVMWQSAIRIQKGGLGPVTGAGGQAAFDIALAEIVVCADQITTVMGRQGGPGSSVDEAVFQVVPVEDNLPAGALGDVIYLDMAPNVYAATGVISLVPAGPNSVTLSEIGTPIARSIPAASGGLEINNLLTGAGFERALTTSDGIAPGTVEGQMLRWDDVSGEYDAFSELIADVPGAFELVSQLTYVALGGINLRNANGEVFLDNVFLGGGQFQYSVAVGGNDGIRIRDDGLVQLGMSGGTGNTTVISGAEVSLTRNGIDQIALSLAPAAGGLSVNNTLTGAGLERVLTDSDAIVAASTAADRTLRGDGSGGWAESPHIRITFSGILQIHGSGFANTFLLSNNNTDALITTVGLTDLNIQNFTNIRADMPLAILEAAAAPGDLATYGQFWVRNDVPNTPMFTDDDGNDFELNAGGSVIFQYAWIFDTATGQADPGVNTIRFNNVVPASITFIYIDDTGPDGQDIGSLIVSNFTDGYQFEAEDPTDADTIQRFLVTGPPTDFTGFWRIPVVNLSAQSGASLPGNGADIQIKFDFHQFIDQGTLSGNSKDMLYWDGNAWNNTGATTRINPNRPAIGGAFALTGSASVDRTTPMMLVSVGNSVSGLWFMQGGIAGDGGYCFGDFTGPDLVSWGWDLSGTPTDLFSIDENLRVTINAAAGFVMAEKAADHGNLAGLGEFWVRNDVPNTPMFTDDVGNDFVLNASGGAGISGTPVNNQLAVWVDASNIEGEAGLTFDSATNFFRIHDTLNTSGIQIDHNGSNSTISNFGVSPGAIVTGSRLVTSASTTSRAGFNVQEGVAPSSPVDGDVWVTAAGSYFARLNGVSIDLAAGGFAAPIVLLDNEQIQFGTGTDVTMDWDGVDFEVESLAASQIFNWRDGGRHRFYDPTDAQYIEIEPVSATVFNINMSNASAGCIFNGANFWRFLDGSLQCEGLSIDGSIASALTMEVAGIERASWSCFPTSLTLSLIQSSGHIYTIQRGINDMWSIQETGGMTVYEDGAADGEWINVRHGAGAGAVEGRIETNTGDLQLSSGDDQVELWPSGVRGFVAQGSGVFNCYQATNTEASNPHIDFRWANGTVRGDLGFALGGAGTSFAMENLVHGGAISLTAEDTGGTLRTILSGTGDGAVSLFAAGTNVLSTQEIGVLGNTSAAQIEDHAGNRHDIGFNDLQIFNDNVSDTLEAQHAGQVAFKDATTARTLTLASNVDLDFPVEAMTTVMNAFTSGNYTVTEGASTTLYYLDGTTRVDTAGGLTVGPGGVCNIWRESATVYYAWGTGITP